MSIELIRRFEPILFFHKDETFFPSDAKRYLEHSELWKAHAPFTNKTLWRRMIEANGIAAAKDEVSQPGQADDTYLGIHNGLTFPLLVSNAQEEPFMNLSGWTNTDGTLETEVIPPSRNQYASLQRLADIYGDTGATIPALRSSRFWYHAEAFDSSRLSQLVENQKFTNLEISQLLAKHFNDPFLLLYYLFFPGHIEGLQGCESIATGPRFADFAGEWACVAIILDRAPQQEPEAKFIGLASRNTTKPDQTGADLDQDHRIGMVIHKWEEVDVFATAPEHAKVFVAKGTHSLYLTPGQKVLLPIRPLDPSRDSCGSTAALTATVIPGEPPSESGGQLQIYFGIYLGKIVASMAAMGIVGVGVLGIVVGVIWSILEDKPAGAPFGSADQVIPPPAPGKAQLDFPPEDGDFGIVVHPLDITPPGVDPSKQVSWPTQDTIPISERTYSIIVDRTNADEAKRQIWFPAALMGQQGYDGRWGPRVLPDPGDRRSGMRFPAFAEMFFSAWAKKQSK